MKACLLSAIVLALECLAGSAAAGLPCAVYSTCELAPVQTIAPCSNTDVIWDPNGAAGHILITVTVKDCLDNPVDMCDVRLDISGEFKAHADISVSAGGFLCGTAGRFAQTNAAGAASFQVDGGGCGGLVLNWTATAGCASPEVELCSVSDTLCVKSTDFAGDGIINFFDTFNFLPVIGSGFGYCGDLTQCSAGNVINFFDTFVYLPALGTPYGCTGISLGNSGTVICSSPMQ